MVKKSAGSVYPITVKGKRTGKWQAQLYINPPGATPKRKTTTCNSKADAQAALRELTKNYSDGVDDQGYTLKGWLDR